MKWALGVALLALAGCNEIDVTTKSVNPQECFSISPSNGNQPFAHILLDKCTGSSWLLVRSRLGDKPEDGYTYQWVILEKIDYRNPHLVSN